MKASVFLILLLASCDHRGIDMMRADVPVEESKPAIRERIVPGTTHGNTALQTETIEALKEVQTADSGNTNCSPVQTNVSDTWAPDEPEPSEFNSAFLRWKELWTLDACNESIDFEVVYMLHKTGIIDVSVLQLEEGEVFTSD